MVRALPASHAAFMCLSRPSDGGRMAPATSLMKEADIYCIASLLVTGEGVAEYRAPQCGQKKVRTSRTGPA